MALITISGYPCSGKSTRAAQIRDSLEHCLNDSSYGGPLTKVVVLSDVNLDRTVYDGRFLL
jgi:protein KTI12